MIRVFLLLIIGIPSWAQIACLTSAECALAKELGISAKLILEHLDDPHHYKISSKDMKMLISEDELILSPKEFLPWTEKIIKKRDAAGKKTYHLKIPDKYYLKYKDQTEIGHYWLYPDITCDLKNELATKLKVPSPPCELLEKEIKKTKWTYVISHDALVPYFESFGVRVLALRSSHHGHQVKAETIKQLDQELRRNNVIWIKERNIHLPHTLENKLKDAYRIINWNPIDFSDGVLTSLNELFKEIEKL